MTNREDTLPPTETRSWRITGDLANVIDHLMRARELEGEEAEAELQKARDLLYLKCKDSSE